MLLVFNGYSSSTSLVNEQSANTSTTSSPTTSTTLPGPEYDATPPLSNARTTVWYWSLGGVSTTLMYSRHTREVWCNGSVLETDVRTYKLA